MVTSPAYLRALGQPREPSELAAHECLIDTNFRDGARDAVTSARVFRAFIDHLVDGFGDQGQS